LKIIFPSTNDWIHDKALGEVNGKKYQFRPDYRSEKLKLIVEFDGLQHYTNPEQVKKDFERNELYSNLGYKVVRIPYFIQLTIESVKILFGVEVERELFDGSYPSLSINISNTPAYLCYTGLKRMAKEFKTFPKQYRTNIEFFHSQNSPDLTGIHYLENEYNQL